MKQNRSTLRRVLSLLRPSLPLLLLSLLLAAAVVVTTLEIPVLTGRAVDAIAGAGAVDFAALGGILQRICLLLGLTCLTQWCMTALTNRASYRAVRDLRTAAFRKLQRLPLRYLDAHPAGDLVSRIITDADQFSEGLLMGFAQLFTGVLTILLTLVFMLRLSPLITVAVICVTPLSIVVSGFIARRSYLHFQAQTKARGAMTAAAEELLGGLTTVQAFGHEPQAAAQFRARDEALRQASFKAVFYSSIANPSTRFVNAMVYAAVGVFGALTALSGGLTVGQLTAFLGYASQYTKPFNEISGVVTELQNSMACAQRLFSLLDEPEESPDGEQTLDAVRGDAAFRGLAFSYTKDRPLLRDIDLSVHAGQRIAIVGPTGCGKTTLINLLMRFYDPDAGAILLDGVDIRKLRRSSLRTACGMVLQDTWLKRATVAENIAMGRPGATRREIEAAAKEAFADSFIRRLPQGYDTVLGEDALSAGQRQLLCIARVMLALPPVLILDEATSSIDTRTELLIQKAFDKLMEGRTSFVVAHRLSTIQGADLILVMKDGRVIEQGTHEALLAANGFYAMLYRSQFA